MIEKDGHKLTLVILPTLVFVPRSGQKDKIRGAVGQQGYGAYLSIGSEDPVEWRVFTSPAGQLVNQGAKYLG